MLTGKPLTGYGISNLELLLLLLGFLALVGAGYWLLRQRWRRDARRSESALAGVREERDRVKAELAAAAKQREELNGQRTEALRQVDRLQHELEQVRALYDPAEFRRLLEQSEREIAHRFGSRLFDIAERCRETVQRVRSDQPDVRIALNEVSAQASEMLHQTKNLVGWGHIGHRKPVWETLRVRQVLEGVVKEQLGYAESRGVCILTDYSSVCPVLTDRLWLHDLCEVVIQNAIKFSPAFGGVVKIMLQPEDDSGRRVFIDAQDNGPGINPKDHARIFDANARGDGQRAPGGGLGLAYGRAIARELGGNLILVESKPNAGSLFRIVLPCAGHHDDAPRADSASQRVPI